MFDVCIALFLNSLCFATAGGLAVDWIHDKVYWIERETGAVRAYNINTKELSTVVTLNTMVIPSKLKILPHIG